MTKEDTKKTRIEVDKETLRKLNILKAEKDFKSHLETIKYLLKNQKKK